MRGFEVEREVRDCFAIATCHDYGQRWSAAIIMIKAEEQPYQNCISVENPGEGLLTFNLRRPRNKYARKAPRRYQIW